jgi:hypothetical protein
VSLTRRAGTKKAAVAGHIASTHAPAMFVVSEAEAAAIRAVFLESGELSAAIDVQARERARTIAGWKPTALKIDWVGPNINNYSLVSLDIPVNHVCPDCTINPTSDAPEPASLALLGVGLLGLGFVVSRKRSL